MNARSRIHLPRGEQLPDVEHEARHRLVLAVLVALMPFLVLVGVVEYHGLPHVLLAVGTTVGLPTLAAWRLPDRRIRSLAASFGLMAASAALVHLWQGRIEAHFLFFVLLPLVALYQDWLPFLVSVATVLAHHAIVGVVQSADVYDHGAGQAAPLTWALVHVTFILALVGVLIIYWNAAESGQRTLAAALVELRTTQQHLVQAQKLESIGELAAGVAHEINTPIQFVGDNLRFLDTSLLELLALVESLDALLVAAKSEPVPIDVVLAVEQARVDLDLDYLVEEIPLALAQSLDGIDRVAEIVRALKGVAHPNSEAWAPADLNDLVRNTLVVTRNEWKPHAQVRTELDAELPSVQCCAGPLSQVFVNMIVNASYAIHQRFGDEAHELGELLVHTETRETGVRVTFRDNGTGMPESVRSRVFDPFFTTKPMGQGTGQGLSLSYAVVVMQHGGLIGIESTVGAGTCFTIDIPLAPAGVVQLAA